MKTVLARHKWLTKCTISEILDTDTEKRYFVATVCGWRGFYLPYLQTECIISEVRNIRDRIESGDESIFTEAKYFKENVLSTL